MREEQILKLFENKVQKKMFVSKTDVQTSDGENYTVRGFVIHFHNGFRVAN